MFKLTNDFIDYANSFDHGFLKEWKAIGIMCTLVDIPDIIYDEVRFLSYLKTSLDMEGFKNDDIELIMGWLFKRLDNFHCDRSPERGLSLPS